MRLLFAILLLAGTMPGQSHPANPTLAGDAPAPGGLVTMAPVGFFDTVPVGSLSARELALRDIRAYREYLDQKYGWSGNAAFTVMSAGGSQSFAVGADGTVTLDNMTMEDALLLVIADADRRTLYEMREQDRGEEERAAMPPAKLNVGKTAYKVTSKPWLGSGVLGTTNCALRKVDILESDRAKRAGVMHELMHVATGCDNSPELHRAIYRLQQPLLKLLQDNPETADYLLKRAPEPRKEGRK